MELQLFWLLCYLSLLLSHGAPTPTDCELIHTSSICQPLIEYSSTSMALTNSTCQNDLELFTNRTLLPLLGIVKLNCRLPLSQLFCSNMYPQCRNNGTISETILPCNNICLNLTENNNCDVDDIQAINLYINTIPILQHLLNCSMYKEDSDTNHNPTSGNCYSPTSSFVPQLPQLPICETYHGTVCKSIVDYPIYAGPGHSSQDSLEVLLSQLPAAQAAVHGEGCYPMLLKFSCSQAFLKCDNTLLGKILGFTNDMNVQQPQPGFASLPCNSICQDYSTLCAGDIPLLSSVDPKLLPNCSTSGKLLGDSKGCDGASTGLLDFPDTQTIYFNNTFTSAALGSNLLVSTSCNNIQKSVEVQCIYPLIQAPFTDFIGVVRADPQYSKSPCELPVSPAYLVNSNVSNIASDLMLLTIPSSILLGFVFFTWLIFPEKRKQRHILFFCGPLWIWTTVNAFAFAAGNGSLTELLRKEPTVPHFGFVPPSYCTFQAFVMFVCGLQSCMWWGIIAFDLFLKAGLEKKFTDHQEKMKYRIYHIVAWSFPILMLIIFLVGNGKFGASQIASTNFCTFTIDSPDWGQYLTFFAPLGTVAITGGTMMIIVIFKIRATILSTLDPTKPDAKRHVKIRNFIIRPIIFVLVKFFLFIWIFIFRIRVSLERAEITEIVTNWITCLQTSNGNTTLCGKEPRQVFGSVTYLGLHFFIGFSGVLVFLLWGTMEDNFYLWYGFCTGQGRNYKKSVGGLSKTKGSKGSKGSHVDGAQSDRHVKNKKFFGERTSVQSGTAPPDEIIPDEIVPNHNRNTNESPDGTELAYLYGHETHERKQQQQHDDHSTICPPTRVDESPHFTPEPHFTPTESGLDHTNGSMRGVGVGSSSSGIGGSSQTNSPVHSTPRRPLGHGGSIGHATDGIDGEHSRSSHETIESPSRKLSEVTTWTFNPLQPFHENEEESHGHHNRDHELRELNRGSMETA